MADTGLDGRKVLVVVTNYGVEQDELVVPVERLREGGARVTIAATEEDEVVTLVGDKDPGRTVSPDTTISAADPADHDLLLLPGGAINADTLRLDDDAVALVQAFVSAGKPVAAICHAPWTLVEAGAVGGKRLTSYWSLKTDLRNAGGTWVDEPVVVDDADGWTLITSRNPDDLDDFVAAIDTTLGAVPA